MDADPRDILRMMMDAALAAADPGAAVLIGDALPGLQADDWNEDRKRCIEESRAKSI